MSGASFYSTVVIQLARLGDLAQTWLLLSGLMRKNGPNSTALVVDSRLAELAGLMVGPDNIVAVPVGDLLPRFAAGGPATGWRWAAAMKRTLSAFAADVVVNLNYHSPAAIIGEAIPAAERRGVRWGDAKAGIPSDPQVRQLFQANSGMRRGARHISDIWNEYGDGAFSSEYWQPIPLPDDLVCRGSSVIESAGINDAEAVIGLITGSGLEARSQPVSYMARIVSELSSVTPLILIGSQKEARTAEDILDCAQASPARVVSLCGRTDNFTTLAGVLSRCRLVIGVDTGPLHLSAMMGNRCLGIYYGSMHFRETGPYGPGNVVIIPDDPDYPCHERDMEAHPERFVAAVPADAVVNTARWILLDEPVKQRPDVRIYRSMFQMDGLGWIDDVYYALSENNRVLQDSRVIVDNQTI